MSASFSSGFAVTSGQVILWPVEVTLAAYKHVLSDPMFWIAYANTFIYAGFGTLATLAIIVPAPTPCRGRACADGASSAS